MWAEGCHEAPDALILLALAQWGSQDYHKQSLRNLEKARQQTKHLCAVILDTIGRELLIRREYELDAEVGARPDICMLRTCCTLSPAHAAAAARGAVTAPCAQQPTSLHAALAACCKVHGGMTAFGDRRQGWPVHTEALEIKAEQQVTVTTDPKAVASSSTLPITYPHFTHMCQVSSALDTALGSAALAPCRCHA